MTAIKKIPDKKLRNKSSSLIRVDDQEWKTLDEFFKYLNQKYQMGLPTLDCSSLSNEIREMLEKDISFINPPPPELLYKAIIHGDITVFKKMVLSDFNVEIVKKNQMNTNGKRLSIKKKYGGQSK
jgi:hypothetical protein